MSNELEMVAVFTTWNEMEADVVAAKLRANGIDAAIEGESIGALDGILGGTLAELRIMVPQKDYDQARALVEDVVAVEQEEEA